MLEPTNSQILNEATRHLRAAQDAYVADPGLSCNQLRIVPPSRFEVETDHKKLVLIVSAPNDPRALPLIIEALRPIRSLDDLLLLVRPDFSNQTHTIPGILSSIAKALNLPMKYPFETIAKAELLAAVEACSKERNLGFTRPQLLGGIVTNSAISDTPTIS